MSGMVNSHPLNGAALASWVKAATVAASIALTATADATRVRGGAASLTGGATVNAPAIRVFPAASTATSQAQGTAYPWYQAAGEAVLVGRATALAACERIVYAEAYGTATVTASAIAESEIGEVIAATSFTLEAEATRNRPGQATLVAEATVDPPPVVFGQTVNLLATSAARAEASTKLSGEAFWRHDGYVAADATGILSQQVTWSVLSVPLGMGFTITAEAVRQQPATATMTVTCLGTADGLAGVPGKVDASAQATGAATGTRVHGAQVAATAGMSVRLAMAPMQGHAATVSASTALSGLVAPSRNGAGAAQASTLSTGNADGARLTWGEASLTVNVVASASGGREHAATAETTMGAVAASGAPYLPTDATAYLTLAGSEYHTAILAVFATQWYAEANATASSSATPVGYATQHYAEAVGTPTTLAISAALARSNRALVYLHAFGNLTANSQASLVGVVNATAGAELVQAVLATQHYAASTGQTNATLTATSTIARYGMANATAGVTISPTVATSHRGQAAAEARLLSAPLVPATNHKGTVEAALVAQGEALGGRLILATVTATGEATGYVIGLRRGDLNAPPERSMIISYEPRGMIVPEAERTLWVPA